MPRQKQFPFRTSIALPEDQGEYLDYLVEKKWFDSQAQAIRFFIGHFQTHKGDAVLPLMIDCVQTNNKEDKL